ncbi:MAG: glycosyltransferase family 2 protein [Paludibacter sp.]|nr:glycosyltransferase family 2 protein [Paludibacter sp.]
MKNPHLSIVTTLYKSQRFLDAFVAQCEQALADIHCDSYELIFVNDGSPDNSLDKVLELKEKNNHIVAVDLSRNFGHHYAIMAGLTYSTGEYVFLIDCDLEVPPTHIPTFYNKLTEIKDCDVVYGIQEKRKGSFIERTVGGLFYSFFNSLTDTRIPENLLTERIMSRRYVDELIRMGDKNIFMAGMMQWVGFKQIPITIKKGLREGESTYTLGKRISLSMQAITSFSSYPLIMLFKFGFFISTLSILTGAYFLIKKLIYPEIVLSGFTFLIVVLLFSVGIIISSLGILGIYIDKLFNQTKNRQSFIVKDIYK